jgi:hypothetical protein
MFNLFPNLLYILGIFPLFILIFAILRSWRTGVIIILIWLYFQDLIRKFLPGQPPQVMLITDVLVFLTYFAFFVAFCLKSKKIWKPPFIISFLFFAGWSILESFNPQLPNLLFAGLGLHTYIWYVPLVFLGYYMFGNKESLLKFLRILVYIAIPLVCLAIFQYNHFDSQSFLIQPLEATWEVHTFGTGVIKLIPSVFGTGDRYGIVGLLLFLLGVGLWFYSKNKAIEKLLISFSIIAAALGVFISGVRAAMYLLIAGVILWIFYYWRISLFKILSLRIPKKLLATILFLLILSFIVALSFKDINRYFYSLSVSELANSRVGPILKDLSFGFKRYGLFGLGTGFESLGIGYIPGGAQQLEKITEEFLSGNRQSESIFIKIWVELGLIGLLLFLIFYGQMLWSLFKETVKAREKTIYPISLSLFLFFFLMSLWIIKGHQIFGEVITQIHSWFFMGVLYKLKTFV